jgi:RNA polymerase sigma-70 factor (ECF subfamily)
MSEDERRVEAVQAAAYDSTPSARPLAALEAVFQKHHTAVFRAAYRVTGNAMDAEDVLQTVFTRLLRRESAGGEPDLSATAAGYLHRAAVNAALDLLRARKRARAVALGEVEEALVDETHADPDRRSRNRELARRLRAALARLSPRQSEVFSLRYLEGLGNLEIARLLGTSQTSIAVILHRARHRLQRELGSLQGEPS